MVLALFLFLISSTNALPQGAPSTVCQSLTPFHGGGIPPQTGVSPYILVPRRQNGIVSVTIESTLGTKFQGIILQGRSPSGEIIGKLLLNASFILPFKHFISFLDIDSHPRLVQL